MFKYGYFLPEEAPAKLYLNSQALSLGLIKSRDEVFITSKLWCTDTMAIVSSLPLERLCSNTQKPHVNDLGGKSRRLSLSLFLLCKTSKLGYFDQHRINFPAAVKPGVLFVPKLEDVVPMDIKSVAQVALRWAYEQGVVIVFRSFNKERLKQYQQNFEESKKIAEIPQSRANLC